MPKMSNWNRVRERSRRHRLWAQAETNAFGSYGSPIKLRREPDEFYSAPRARDESVSLPKLKFLERPDP